MSEDRKSVVEEVREAIDRNIDDHRLAGTAATAAPSDVAHDLLKGRPTSTVGMTESEKVALDVASMGGDTRTDSERPRSMGLDPEKRRRDIDEKAGSDERRKANREKREAEDRRKAEEAKKESKSAPGKGSK